MTQTASGAPLNRLVAQRDRIARALDLEQRINKAVITADEDTRSAVDAILQADDERIQVDLREGDRVDLQKAVEVALSACVGALFNRKKARADTAAKLRETYFREKADQQAKRLEAGLRQAIDRIRDASQNERCRIWGAVYDATKGLTAQEDIHRDARNYILQAILKAVAWAGSIVLIVLAAIAIWIIIPRPEQPIQIGGITPDSVIQQSGDVDLMVEGANFTSETDVDPHVGVTDPFDRPYSGRAAGGGVRQGGNAQGGCGREERSKLAVYGKPATDRDANTDPDTDANGDAYTHTRGYRRPYGLSRATHRAKQPTQTRSSAYGGVGAGRISNRYRSKNHLGRHLLDSGWMRCRPSCRFGAARLSPDQSAGRGDDD
jgi:hypothetical protein